MPTTKNRINLSVPAMLNRVLEKIASRDQMSVSAKTLELVGLALEIEEDLALLQAVQKRTKGKLILVSHEEVWG